MARRETGNRSVLYSPVPLALTVLIALSSIFLYLFVGHESQYIFSPSFMKSTVAKALERHEPDDVSGMVNTIVQELRKKHGDHIIADPPWMFNNAGGAMGSMLILHCSLSEYVIIFGTAVGTEGHTGRFLADDYFTMFHGDQWAFRAGSLEREVYKPGDQHHLPRGVSKQYRCADACWALEYARGNILSMLPFGLLDTLFSTLDVVTLWRTAKVSAIGMGKEILKGKI